MKRRILVASVTPTHPPHAGSRVRLLRLAQLLEDLGHDVEFLLLRDRVTDAAPMRAYWGSRYHEVAYRNPATSYPLWRRIATRAARVAGLTFPAPAVPRDGYGIDDWWDPGCDDAVRRVIRDGGFDTILLLYVFYSRVFQLAPAGTLKLLDPQDIYARRHDMYRKQGMQPVWYSTTEAGETEGLDRADWVLSIQDREADYFRPRTRARVVTIGHAVDLASSIDPQRPPCVAYVASANPDNLHAFRTFLAEAFPVIQARAPSLRFLLAGPITRAFPDVPAAFERVEGDDLAGVYGRASICVNPARTGTGLKIKTIEAMGQGLATVATPVGGEGLEDGWGTALRVVNNPQELADTLVELAGSDEARNTLRRNALAYCTVYNATVRQRLADIVGRA